MLLPKYMCALGLADIPGHSGGPPVCGPPDTSWMEATADTRAWIMAMMARRSGVGASASMLASPVPSSSSLYPSKCLYLSLLLSPLVWGRVLLTTVAGHPVGVGIMAGEGLDVKVEGGFLLFLLRILSTSLCDQASGILSKICPVSTACA